MARLMVKATDWIGQRVADYRIEEVLGEGGMGIVFRAIHETLGQVVAVKMLHPELMSDEKLRSRFIREAQALARLNHPNIVRLIAFPSRADTCFIVMEYIEGRTIDQILLEKRIIPACDAIDWYTQVLAAMHYAHSLGIVHRDIKPSNICILKHSALVKILDFGTAKMVGAQRLTEQGMTLGTLIYMSPEQIVGRELDHRSDIYSLGVTLYEIVTGKLPHYSEDEMELVRAIARGVPEPPSVHYKHLPKRLEKTIMRAIEKDPAKRYQTAEEFLSDVKECQDELKIKERKRTPPSGQRSAIAEGELGAGGRRASFLAVALVGVLCGIGGGFALLMLGTGGGSLTAGFALIAAGTGIAIGFGSLGLRGRSSAAPPTPALAPPSPLEGTIDISSSSAPAPSRDGAVVSPARSGGASPGTAIITVLDGGDRGRSWPLPHGAITIGRGPHNTIVLTDPGVSTSHAQIGFDGAGYVLADLQSRNGSYVNSRRIERAALRDRDVIVFGSTQIAVSIPVG